MIREIRPYQLMSLFDAPPHDREVCVQMPFRRGYGSLTALETMILLAALRTVRAERVFEFGTFRGSTTLNLALNIPEGGRVFTLDLGEDKEIDQHAKDALITLARRQSRTADFQASRVEARITELTGDSTRFDFSPWRRSIDLVFIDGGHDLETVASDTRNAFDLVARDRPAAILWHDYANKDYPELSDHLRAVAAERDVFHVGDTMLCAWFSDPATVARLRA